MDAVRAPHVKTCCISSVEEAHAIHQVGSFGLDVSSGVRTHGSLDEEKLSAFMDAVHGASRAQEPP